MRRLPVIEGIIKRRLLINFRAEPVVVQRLLPASLRPKLHDGCAIVGICLIRLEQIRPAIAPLLPGISSENAAHRIAVEWTDDTGPKEGVFIPRRDTGSLLNAAAGGRIFPGEHHHARFEIEEGLRRIDFKMHSRDGAAIVEILAQQVRSLPAASCFSSVAESSAFFQGGCIGYSATCDPVRFDGVRLETARWQVHALDVLRVRSTFFEDPDRFPPGSVAFDHGLIMRNIPHRWHSEPDLHMTA
ncbi:MAG: DUF2071 domain-containing protein [Chthoniobacterales bacterium]